ncbi:MAG: hypothetical protein ABGY75_15825 [Gemmataceae bacterium]
MRRADSTGFLRAAALAVVLVCAWAGGASASCGDYLHVQPPAGKQQPCSCQHGECHPPVPLPQSGEPTTTELSRSADALLELTCEPPVPTTRGWLTDSVLRPSRTSTGVFHPPRG